MELSDTKRLYSEVTGRFGASSWGDRSEVTTLCSDLQLRIEEYGGIPKELDDPFTKLIVGILTKEDALFPIEEVDWHTLSMEEQVELRNKLRAQQYFLDHEEKIVETIIHTVASLVVGITRDLADIPQAQDSFFTAPLCHLLHDTNNTIESIFSTISGASPTLFSAIQEQLYINLCTASDLVPYTEHKKPYVYASKKKLPPLEAVKTYLRATPFYNLLTRTVALDIPHEAFFSHAHVIGGSGAGKTQLLSHMVLKHITDPKKPSIIVIDSQGDFIKQLSHLKAIQDRLVLITPKDIKYPQAINIFDLKQSRSKQYDEITKEQVEAGALQTLNYVIRGVVGANLTAKQSVFFEFVIQLLLSLPDTLGRNAVLQDMIDLMDDMTPYQAAIDALPPIQKRFFERDFSLPTFKDTKEQVRYRINAILKNKTLQRLFSAPATKLDLFEELNQGSIILVDTAKEFLKDGSASFGRIFIALVLQAVLERAAIPETKRRSTFLIIDEAQEYFDSNIDDLLTQVRKYKCGCTFAHQYLAQCTPDLKASLAANTAIKMVSGVSMADARVLAPDLRTTPDFIAAQRELEFATYIKKVTTTAVSIPIAYGVLNDQPVVDNEAYREFLARNRKKLSFGNQRSFDSPSTDDTRQTPSEPDGQDDIDTTASETW